jgi:hypothetical protein
MKQRDHTYHPIAWVKSRLKEPNGFDFWIGFCGKTRHAAFLAMEAIEVLIVRDLIISKDGSCEEAERCLYFNCPLNKTNRYTFRSVKEHGEDEPINSDYGEQTFDQFFPGRDITSGVISGKDDRPIIELSREGLQ